MPQTNRYALKEWAIQVDALLAGRQTLLLRKGGIFEKRGEFEVEHREFFLFPTLYHEKAGELVAGAREGLEEVQKRYVPDAKLHLPGYCLVEEARWVDNLDLLLGLEGLHPLAPSAVEYRYNYGKQRGLNVLFVRSWRLPQPHVLEMQHAYEGCVSWVDLGQELSSENVTAVLSEEELVDSHMLIRKRLRK